MGHINTDTGSVASAIGAAYLFNGVAAIASEINNETSHLFIYFLQSRSSSVWASLQVAPSHHPPPLTQFPEFNHPSPCDFFSFHVMDSTLLEIESLWPQ